MNLAVREALVRTRREAGPALSGRPQNSVSWRGASGSTSGSST